jgi:glutaredoxin
MEKTFILTIRNKNAIFIEEGIEYTYHIFGSNPEREARKLIKKLYGKIEYILMINYDKV